MIVSGSDIFAYAATVAVYVLRTEDKRLERIVAGFDKSITAIEIDERSPQLLAVGSSDFTLRIFDISRGNQSAELLAYTQLQKQPKAVRFHPLGRNALLFIGGNVFAKFDWQKNQVQTLKLFDDGINAMSVNLKEARVALAVADIVQVVELSTSKSWRIGVEGRLQSLRWDALSEGYLLCAFQDGSLSLYDVKEKRAVQSFSRQAGLSDVSWIRSMPGMFVSGTSRNDVLRLWNVSQGQPVSQIRIESGAGISAIVDTPRKEEAIVAFKDGSLCVANLRGERVSWSFEGGHTETVFSCRFSPNDDHLLASASYDGSIRLWDLEMNRQQSHIQVSTSAPLFSLAWSLDGRRVAASGHYGRTFLVDTEKGKVNQVVEHHNSNEPVLRVDQHPTDPELLASSGKDGLLCVFDWNGALKQRFTHRKQLMVCEWHPLREGLLAVSCADGNIYVWDYQRPNTPLQRFGHNNEVSPFGVSWSPHQPELLCVTCDNCTACVWNIDDGTCSTLTGHTSKVRACLWHPEIPNILLTGSWDNSIRVYDVHTSTCIYQAVEHVSDVYAFSIHPNRWVFFPFNFLKLA